MIGTGSLSALFAQAAPAVQRVAAETLHPTWCPPWAFWTLALLIVGGAVVTLTRSNLIGAVMALVATFVGIASLYALLAAHFLAAIQVLVYAGAIMVLFVFVIMVLNREEDEPWALNNPVVKAAGTGALVFCLVRIGEFIVDSPPLPTGKVGMPPTEFGTVHGLAEYFFTEFLFPFEGVSLLLMIAVIGAIVLARTIAKPTSVHELPVEQQPKDPAQGEDSHATDASAGHGAGGH
jgi:NADH-quinone oxidoreductase subunit J